MKNNYSTVKVWNYELEAYDNSGEQFCGLVMGDHTKCGINTMLNTGTVTGIFGIFLVLDFQQSLFHPLRGAE